MGFAVESGKNSRRWEEKGRHGVQFTQIFLNDCWKNKEIVRRFKGNDNNDRMLNLERLNGQLSL